jgi:hypothetical protein
MAARDKSPWCELEDNPLLGLGGGKKRKRRFLFGLLEVLVGKEGRYLLLLARTHSRDSRGILIGQYLKGGAEIETIQFFFILTNFAKLNVGAEHRSEGGGGYTPYSN